MPEAKTPEEIAAEEAAAKAKADADAAAAATHDGDDGDDFDKDRAMATIRKLRDEVKAAKADGRRAAELEKRLKDLEDAEKSELEKAQERIATLESSTKATADRLRAAHLLVALGNPDHGIVNAEAAAKLIEGVEYDDDGRPANLADVLPDFLEQNAFLVSAGGKPRPPKTNAGDGGGEQAPALTADQLDWAKRLGMTAEEYAAYAAGDTMTLTDAHKVRESTRQ